MSVQFLQISLNIMGGNNEVVTIEQFLRRLLPTQRIPYPHTKSKRKPFWDIHVDLFTTELKDHEEEEEPSEAMFSNIKETMNEIAGWLADWDEDTYMELKELGMEFRMLITSWIENDQFEIYFSPCFIKEVGKKEMALDIITND